MAAENKSFTNSENGSIIKHLGPDLVKDLDGHTLQEKVNNDEVNSTVAKSKVHFYLNNNIKLTVDESD